MIIWHTPLQNQDIQTCPRWVNPMHFRSWSFSKCFEMKLRRRSSLAETTYAMLLLSLRSAHIPRVTAFNDVCSCFILLFTILSSYSYLVDHVYSITMHKHNCPRETVIIASVLGGNLCCLDLTTLVQWDYPHILDISNSSVDDLDARHDVCEVRLLYVDYSWLFRYGTDRIGYSTLIIFQQQSWGKGMAKRSDTGIHTTRQVFSTARRSWQMLMPRPLEYE